MPQKLALVIGNSEYQDPALAKLKAPDADVRALTELLRDPEIGQFDDVLALVNETEAHTRRAIATFFVRARPDDVLLLYFSGHGLLDDRGRLYLAAPDTQRDLPYATAISAAFVTDAMDNSRSRQQLLILDCCHSGAFARGARSGTEAKAITQATFEGLGSGRAVLTATDATQYAWEGESVIGSAENSVFTHFVIEGLKTGAADTDSDGEITLEELYTYLYSEVVRLTPKQTPRKWSYNQSGEFLIARNPNPGTPKALPLPDDLQASLEDLRPWVREGSLRELERLMFGSVPGLAVAAHAALLKLKDDDSRRVAVAAADTITKYEAVLAARQQQAEAARQAKQAERAAREQAEADRKAAEQAARLAAEQAEAARAKAEAERIAAEHAEAARAKAEADRKAAEEVERARAKAEAERMAAELAELARIKAEADRMAAEEAERARAKAEAERIAAEKAEAERVKAEADRIAAEEAERARAEAEAERIAAEKAEADRLAVKELEAARARAEVERVAAERARQARAQAEAERRTAEMARQVREKAEAERIAAEKAEADRLAADKAARDKAAAEEAERARAKAEADRLAAEEAEAGRTAAAKAEADRLAAQRAEQARAMAEADRLAAEKAARDKAAAEQAELALAKAAADKAAADKAAADKAAADKAARDLAAANLLASERAAQERAEARRQREKADSDRLAADRASKSEITTPIPAPDDSPGLPGGAFRSPPVPSVKPAAARPVVQGALAADPLAALTQAGWFPFVMIALGWAISRGLVQIVLAPEKPFFLGWFLNWVIGAAAGGFITGLALRRLDPAVPSSVARHLAAGWAGAWALGWILEIGLYQFGNEAGLSGHFALLDMVAAVVFGAVGGYTVGAVWRAAQPRLSQPQVWQLAAGWAGSWLVGVVALELLRDERGLVFAWSGAGLIGGALGGGLMMWMARQVRSAAAPAPLGPPGPLPAASPLAMMAPLALMAAGWGLGWLLAQAFFLLGRTWLSELSVRSLLDFIGWTLSGLVGGWATGLALRLAAPAVGWKQLPSAAAAWAASLAVGWMAAVAVSIFADELGAHLPDGPQLVLGLAVAGWMGGRLMAAYWQRQFPALRQPHVVATAAGWALALAFVSAVFWAILTELGGSNFEWLVGWTLSGALAGAIGGAVMLWQFTTRRGGA